MSAAEVVAVGETMIMLVPEQGARLENAARVSVHVGGAESNVAVYLARLGVDVRWASVLHDEPFARRIVDELSAAGVDTSAVVWSPDGQTGVYLKDPSGESTTVYYYRRHSAATLMGPSLWKDERLRGARVLHLSGITPAISDSARETVERAVIDRAARADTVSLDINYRRDLWSPSEAAAVLAPLANAADLLFVGLDEAKQLWGCESADDVRAALPEARTLVVKDGGIGAHAFTPEEYVFVPARRVEIVEAVGAGDAFAAGYIAGLLKRRPVAGSLRLGHLLAGAALSVHGDLAPLPADTWLQAQGELPDDEWAMDTIPARGGG